MAAPVDFFQWYNALRDFILAEPKIADAIAVFPVGDPRAGEKNVLYSGEGTDQPPGGPWPCIRFSGIEQDREGLIEYPGELIDVDLRIMVFGTEKDVIKNLGLELSRSLNIPISKPGSFYSERWETTELRTYAAPGEMPTSLTDNGLRIIMCPVDFIAKVRTRSGYSIPDDSMGEWANKDW